MPQLPQDVTVIELAGVMIEVVHVTVADTVCVEGVRQHHQRPRLHSHSALLPDFRLRIYMLRPSCRDKRSSWQLGPINSGSGCLPPLPHSSNVFARWDASMLLILADVGWAGAYSFSKSTANHDRHILWPDWQHEAIQLITYCTYIEGTSGFQSLCSSIPIRRGSVPAAKSIDSRYWRCGRQFFANSFPVVLCIRPHILRSVSSGRTPNISFRNPEPSTSLM